MSALRAYPHFPGPENGAKDRSCTLRLSPGAPNGDGLTILAEDNANGANHRAVETCKARWLAARREVVIIEPSLGNDFNNVIRGRA